MFDVFPLYPTHLQGEMIIILSHIHIHKKQTEVSLDITPTPHRPCGLPTIFQQPGNSIASCLLIEFHPHIIMLNYNITILINAFTISKNNITIYIYKYHYFKQPTMFYHIIRLHTIFAASKPPDGWSRAKRVWISRCSLHRRCPTGASKKSNVNSKNISNWWMCSKYC